MKSFVGQKLTGASEESEVSPKGEKEKFLKIHRSN